VSELILGTVAFFLIFLLLAKFAFPNIKKTLDERADKIEGGLARAAAAQDEANRVLAEYQTQLDAARTEAAGIRASAQSDRQAIVEQARGEAQEAAATVTARAQEQIAAERSSVAASLKQEIGELALDLAGKIVGESLADDAKARAAAWNLPDPVPVHREPLYTPRTDLVAKYPTRPDGRQFRMMNAGFSVQKAAVEKGIAKDFPIILTSGRLVEYEGGGEETRSNKWLAELQQDMFVEINPADAAARGIADGGWVWVSGPENKSRAKVKALVTDRVGKGVAFMPFHFGGWYQGVDQRGNYPKGTDPIVLGESVNTVTTYGYDPVTGMHEGKVTLCQIQAA